MMRNKREFITIPAGKSREAQMKFGVQKSTVWRAAQFISNSAQSENIRKWLIDNGGVCVRVEEIPTYRFKRS